MWSRYERRDNRMTNRELVLHCPYERCATCYYEIECEKFRKAYHFSPYYGDKESDEFLDREVGETE